ncbi:MAG: hypothetical protein LBO78_00905 [Rickettsiales bacterium]|jgi:DNA-binding response OmpR family regulator|nr:hypothetical protein [Rickettsiales bacterium]
MANICFKTGDALLFELVKAAVEDGGRHRIVAAEPADGIILDMGGKLDVDGAAELPKPFRMSSLLSLLDAAGPLSFGGFRISGCGRSVEFGGKSAMLTAVEAKLLEALLAAENGLEAKAAPSVMLGYSPAEPSKVCATHIYNLRKKLFEISGRDDLIVLENGLYRLKV